VQAAARLGVPPDIDAGPNDVGGSTSSYLNEVGGSINPLGVHSYRESRAVL